MKSTSNYLRELTATTMHAVGIHSALAIKRQRKRRDVQRKVRERRYSIQSSESGETHSPHGSTRRKFHPHKVHMTENHNLDTKVVTSIGMLHIGVVFVVFGIFLLGAGFFPDNLSNQPAQTWHLLGKGSWWNELICTGLFAVGLGIFLIILNCVISNREEQDLESYVQRQLTRSRSAVLGASGEILLEKILEEDSSYGDPDYYSRNAGQSPPGADNDKRLLLVQAGPISVSGNNVGDIVTVGVNLEANVDTKIDSTIVNVLVALLTKMGDVQLPPPEQLVPALLQMQGGEASAQGEATELGAAGNYLKELLGHFKEHPEQLKQLLSSESAGKLMEQFLQ
ncbi:hypothetical protein pipiens_001841 [Culex pipiens pipiens]|uniref:Uncharacterized protein n=1 Tax=Culex pipiens pipiens TaxID=38569 RepID=A0ABD1DSJ8_CULPP